MHTVRPLLLVPVLLFGACASEPARDPSLAERGRDVFGRSGSAAGAAWNTQDPESVRIPSELGPDAWTIVLTAVHSDSPERAASVLEQVRTVGKLPDAFQMERNGRYIIAVGGFKSPTDPVAAVELDRVRGIEIDGELPYARAFLAPPSGELSRGTIPEYDLRNARAQYGKDVKYTLQIAVYGREDGTPATSDEIALFRKTAEDAARALRQSGELAFYYHGPNRSMVTVGVFTEDEHHLEQGYPVESARLQMIRDRHPRNLLNGRTIVEKVRSASGGFVERDQKSFLVSIP